MSDHFGTLCIKWLGVVSSGGFISCNSSLIRFPISKNSLNMLWKWKQCRIFLWYNSRKDLVLGTCRLVLRLFRAKLDLALIQIGRYMIQTERLNLSKVNIINSRTRYCWNVIMTSRKKFTRKLMLTPLHWPKSIKEIKNKQEHRQNSIWNHFQPVFHFYSSWEHLKISG